MQAPVRLLRAKGLARMAIRFCLVLAAGMILAGCPDSESVKKVDLSKRQSLTVRERQEEVTYAYLPQYSHAVSYQRHHLLVEHLARVTGLRFRQLFPDTFDEHLNMVAEGRIDISFSNPFIYIKIADQGLGEAFARAMEPSGPNFRGQIICRSDDKSIKNLSNVRGKSWIAVDPSSAGGYLFALGHFAEHGISRDDFSRIAFSPGPGGKQEKVVLSVYSGEFEVGSIREGTLDVVKDTIDLSSIRVLAVTRWYPGWVWAARKDMDPDAVRKIRLALTTLTPDNPAHRAILDNAGLTGIMPSSDADFDPVRQLARSTGMETAR